MLEEDAVYIESEVVSIAGKVVTVKHLMKNTITDNLCSECIMKWVLFDKKIRKAIAILDELYALLQKKN